MQNGVREQLREWRRAKAEEEGVELFRILSNQAIEEITAVMPKTKKELLAIKGFKERKFQKYGHDILVILGTKEGGGSQGSLFGTPKKLNPHTEFPHQKRELYNEVEKELFPKAQEARKPEQEEKIFTVSDYLGLMNVALRDFEAKVKGEISSLDIRGNYLFFGLKDKDDESMLNCFMWQTDYRVSGVKLEEGMEIMVYGYPELYKKTGRMSMRVETVELVGEGALKKAYDALKTKLEKEGIFAEERKRPIPDYPHTIGLITSKTGAVIHDFLNNLGKFGYHVQLFDSRVEGQLAVKDLQRGIRYFKNKDIDVLIIIRGGGSLESLMAFNNETLVREIAAFPRPVLCGIGHDKDVPLMSLAADRAASTPTAVTHILNHSWQQAIATIRIVERDMMHRYEQILTEARQGIEERGRIIEDQFKNLFEYVRGVRQKMVQGSIRFAYILKEVGATVEVQRRAMTQKFNHACEFTKEQLRITEETLRLHDPMRQLKMGYSIIAREGKIIRSIQEVKKGVHVDIRVTDGTIDAEVITIKNEEKSR